MKSFSSDLHLLPTDLRHLIELELEAGEKITWVGTPVGRRFAMKSIGVFLFGIPFTLFAMFWIAGASGFKIPDFNKGLDFFPLFGVPFFLIGLGLLCSPLFMLLKARKTAYVLTNQRAILFNGGFGTTIRSFFPDQLTDIHRNQWSDGSGDLIMDRSLHTNSEGHRRTVDHGFLAISDVREVERLVRDLIKNHKNSDRKTNR